ncbi:hypothetical protein BpHYR1_050143 [Brachionus plicatilis]|uniref:Uncharacterized protein n=1 Tax=Brachionus plicatilis TaxID=10195 RepID=A0A3M7Q7I8_BRAPC|nr:hypothetical protein BpHYR1_050143 [Brachionus plicatilis]
MVLLNGLKFTIGHTLIFIYYLQIKALQKISCLYDLSRFMILTNLILRIRYLKIVNRLNSFHC